VKFSNILSLGIIIAVTFLLILSGAGSIPFSLPISTSLLLIGTGIALILNIGNKKTRAPSPVIFFLLLILFVIISCIPLPGIFNGIAGNLRARQNAIVSDALTQAADIKIIDHNESPWFSLTRNRAGSIKIALLLTGMLCSAFLASSLTPKARKFYIRFLVGIMTFLAAAGFLHQWVWPKPKTLLWFLSVQHGNPLGCFMNRTNHGGYLAMILPISLNLYALAVTRKKLIRIFLFGSVSLFTAFAICSTLSRGAFISAIAGSAAIFIFTLIGTRHEIRSRAALALAALSLIAITTVAVVPATGLKKTVSERMTTLLHPMETHSAQARISLIKDSARIWKDYPMLGIGANAFRMIYPQYRSRDDRKLFYSPENEYVQLLTDTGIIGTLLAFLAIASFVVFCRKKALLYSPDQKETMRALLSCSLVVILHNAVDFPLHNPLYAFTFASMIGLMWPFYSDPSASSAPGRITGKSAGLTLISFAVILLVCLSISGTVPYRRDSSDHTMNAGAEELARSITWAPTSWQAWYHFGRACCIKGTREAITLGIACIDQALEYDPKNYRLWYQLGLVKLNAGDKDGADRAFERANSLRSWLKAPGINTEKL